MAKIGPYFVRFGQLVATFYQGWPIWTHIWPRSYLVELGQTLASIGAMFCQHCNAQFLPMFAKQMAMFDKALAKFCQFCSSLGRISVAGATSRQRWSTSRRFRSSPGSPRAVLRDVWRESLPRPCSAFLSTSQPTISGRRHRPHPQEVITMDPAGPQRCEREARLSAKARGRRRAPRPLRSTCEVIPGRHSCNGHWSGGHHKKVWVKWIRVNSGEVQECFSFVPERPRQLAREMLALGGLPGPAWRPHGPVVEFLWRAT